jgi:oxygen-independent coproporphyrinogen-3 oxidase
MSELIPLGLYLHFPWCVSKCPYCDFNSHALREGVAGRDTVPEAAYIESLQADLEHQLETQAALIGARRIATVFMGGGTPSLFSPAAIDRVLEFVRRRIGLEPQAEITLEANPGTIERGRFAEYAAAGVNRVSLGAQSFDTAALQALGRIHSPDDTQRATAELHAAGLANFNLDLMYGLPAQDRARALQDVAMAIALEPAQISHYHLTLEPGTPFAARPPAHLPDDESTETMLEATSAALAEAGYARYEVSAYARAGRRCAHNLLYWQFGDYLGVGAGAHGKLSGIDTSGTNASDGLTIRRSTQPREPRRYQRDPRGGLLWRDVAVAERPFEFMLNAMRLAEGFDGRLFEARTGVRWSTVEPTLRRLGERDLLTLTGDRAWQVAPTATGLRWLNELLLEFLSAEADTRPGRRS